ncbi:MAG: hypothetical protein FWH33_01705 [Oscillospiraceae bacterium]|nr:hypothetical protein [Oscillospiraceae bacterium]
MKTTPAKAIKVISAAVAIAAMLSVAAIIADVAPASAADPFRNLAADAALLIEVDSGTVLFERNATRRHPADALTRTMTLLLAVIACEDGDVAVDDIVEMTESAFYNIDTASSAPVVQPGESMLLLDLMHCALVGNSGEAFNMIAEHVAGNAGKFLTEMNAKAKELGCLDTNFTNTHGQYNQMQYTNAIDQSVIFREAMKHQLFVEISSALRYDMPETETSAARKMTNQNSLLNPNSKYYYRPCTSGVTSATYEGGYSFVAYAESEGLSLISVVLGSDVIIFEDESAEMRNLTETRRLFEWGFSNFSRRTIISPVDLVGKVPVTHGAGADFVNLRPDSSITLLLDNDIKDEDFTRKITVYNVEANETLYAPVSAGDVLGEMSLSRNGIEIGTVLLVANTSIELHKLQYIKVQVTDILTSKVARLVIWVLTMLILGYVALVIRYNVLRRRRLRKIAEAKQRLREERQNPHRDE